jgi:hypothetical protein
MPTYDGFSNVASFGETGMFSSGTLPQWYLISVNNFSIEIIHWNNDHDQFMYDW